MRARTPPQLPLRTVSTDKNTYHVLSTLGRGVQGKVKRGVCAETGQVSATVARIFCVGLPTLSAPTGMHPAAARATAPPFRHALEIV